LRKGKETRDCEFAELYMSVATLKAEVASYRQEKLRCASTCDLACAGFRLSQENEILRRELAALRQESSSRHAGTAPHARIQSAPTDNG
jgi:ribosomal protein L29